MLTVTVSQLNRYVKSVLDSDNMLSDVYVKGELSNFRDHYSSGHLYFALKDEKASIRGVMFAGHAKHLKFTPEEGMELLVKGSVSLYEVDGSYQLYVTDMQPYGIGATELAVKQLTEKLEKAGLFKLEHKKPLPDYPKTIGVITSKTGAAIQDIIKTLDRRYPLATVKFAPALVQGDQAPASLISSLDLLDGNCDVIIIGRGGGSKEDLWAFNNESLAYRIFEAETPIISAVGHETDITICDMVADHRASTPSSAAEMVAPPTEEILLNIQSIKETIRFNALRQLEIKKQSLSSLSKAYILKSPKKIINQQEKQLDFIVKTMYNIHIEQYKKNSQRLSEYFRLLESLNPISILKRGYLAGFRGDVPVTTVKELSLGEKILLKFKDGEADVVIDKIYLEGKDNE